MGDSIEGQFAKERGKVAPAPISELAQQASREEERVNEVAALRAKVDILSAKSEVLAADLSTERAATAEQRNIAAEAAAKTAAEAAAKASAEAEAAVTKANKDRDRLALLNKALETENGQLRTENSELKKEKEVLQARVEVLNTMVAKLREKLGEQDELVIELQQVIAGFEHKAVFEWPKESKLGRDLQLQIIRFLEMGDIVGLENLLDHEIRYDSKLRTLLTHRHFKEEVERVYGRYFKRRYGPARRAADTQPGIPIAESGRTTIGVGPSASRLGILFIDLDNFKQLNDTMGHLAGDAALKKVEQVLNESLREADIKGRFGGEELEVALELENAADGMKVADKICAAIRNAVIEHEGKTFQVTASVGIAELGPEQELDTLIDNANWAMKYAKHQGRNQYVPWDFEEAQQWAAAKKAEEAAKRRADQPKPA